MTMNRYEKIWIGFSVVMVVTFLALIAYFAFVTGFQVPHKAEVIDPRAVGQDERFSSPRVVEVVPGKKYEVYLVARMWNFNPREIEVPEGAEVKFIITSPDVVHGFEVVGTNVNGMVLPGYVTVITTRFNKAGEFLMVCNEYCGSPHYTMSGKLTVRGR